MYPIIAPLNHGHEGAAVANLQAGLVLLLNRQIIEVTPDFRTELLNGLTQESREQVYKDATQGAVAIFQQQRQLERSGIVDERTAAALNNALRSLGAFDAQQVVQRRVVAGQVLQGDDTPFRGTVIVLQEGGAGSLRLGEAPTDPEGRYAIAYALADDAPTPTLRVAAFDSDGQRRAEATIEAARPIEVVDLRVQGEGRAFLVSGQVASETRAGVGGLRVLIVDKNVGGDTLLDETTTTTEGSYRVAFQYNGQKQQPDLQARALQGERLLGTSAVRYNATNRETLNILVEDSAATALATEHEALRSDLAAHVPGTLRDLQENDGRQDVTYLANKTGWDARAVALASLADTFAAGTANAAGTPEIDPALFYTLFRAGVPANDDALYRTSGAEVANIWRQGIAQGIVPSDLEARIPDALAQFQSRAADHALSSPAVAGLSSLSEMLAVSLPNENEEQPNTERHKAFVKLQLQHQGDPVTFWDAVEAEFGNPAAKRLRLDGQLGYLTLNNAALTAKLHASLQTPLTDPVELISQGYHQPAAWLPLLDGVAVPPEIAGENDMLRRANYADALASQLRISYPTASVAAMVKAGATPTVSASAYDVQAFLMQHHQQFSIGTQPIEQYVARNAIELSLAVQQDITRIQRVRQITPSDRAMNALLEQNIDSAYKVVHYDRDEFVTAFAEAVGSVAEAELIYAKAGQVHNAVLNIATSYLLASNAPPIGVHSPAHVIAPAPQVPANVGDVIAYPTLEKLFGEMDYCECEHCRSVLSPAAYLVDLLQFLDRDAPRWREFQSQWQKKYNLPYPYTDQTLWEAAGKPGALDKTPLDVLLERRPDLEHLPLTCENINIALPYIDLVNETLEFFITNTLTLENYTGYSTDGSVTPEALLANPQFVQDEAYQILAGTSNPAPILPPTTLPFHYPLESLRRTYAAFEVSLPQLMADLRIGDDFERPTPTSYGWRDIWLEELQLSRSEYARLSDSTLTLQQLYGFPAATTDDDLLTNLSNARAFTRRIGISYAELIALLKTRFINPNATLLPLVERLEVPLSTLRDFKAGALTAEQFALALSPGLDAAPYGGDIGAWVLNQQNYDQITGLLTLADPTGTTNAGSFARLEFRYADPDRLNEQVRPFEFVRLLRFVRLWKKLGWSIEQTDRAIAGLYPPEQLPNDADDTVNLARLDAGFGVLLPRLGVLKRVIERLKLKLKSDLDPLLDCFGALISDTSRVAFGQEWLARRLKLSLAELLLLERYSGLTAFEAIDPTNPAILRLLDLLDELRAIGLKPAHALYLIWNQDLSGRASPAQAQINAFACNLRSGFAATESEFAVADDPDGQIARARMALVYDNEATDLFFALLNNTLVSEIPYSHPGEKLDQTVLNVVGNRLSYDNFRKRLSFAGLISTAMRDALKVGATLDFEKAVDKLYDENQAIIDPLFTRYPELQALYLAYSTSNEPVEKRRAALLEQFLPILKQRRKRQQALEAIGAAAKTTATSAATLLDQATVLHSAADSTLAGLADLTALEQSGLSVAFYLRNTATGEVDPTPTIPTAVDYRAAGPHKLPANAGNAISGVWRGYLEAPESSFFNLAVEAEAGATVSLHLNGTAIEWEQNDAQWRNKTPLELQAGVLYALEITVENVRSNLKLQWQTRGRGWEVVPVRYLYAETLLSNLQQTYSRFFKSVSLQAGLKLSVNELAHLAAQADYHIDRQGWLNGLPVTGDPDAGLAAQLFGPFRGLLAFAQLKAALAPDDEQLLAVLADPLAAAQVPGGLLWSLTRWEKASLDPLLAHVGQTYTDLGHVSTLRRVFKAYEGLATLGISASALLAATTNEPGGAIVRALHAALRVNYAESDWFTLLKPINDELRSLRRDALVAYVLHQMSLSELSAHIDTPEKLFEYFLIDVQMEPCMQTSRIRHALSSVQLFIERCLMNLEPRIAASALNAKHWAWMKRYRVWEANRKVFLWPENWLEPELRDDQSPFFKEAMSELLQGDITEDRAATVLLTYLSKLDEVAKLEACGIHYVENSAGIADDVVHVVARTAGANRKYYYRRRKGGSWTPWEQIKLDIEDNPIIPVVWNDRLFLFWLRILKQVPGEPPTPISGEKSRNLTEIKVQEINNQPTRLTIQAILCWSEYYNGTWQPTKTSDVNKPVSLGTFGMNDFDRPALILSIQEEGKSLRIGISGQGSSSFLLHNTHSLPQREAEAGGPIYQKRLQRTLSPNVAFGKPPGTLHLGYDPARGPDDTLNRNVLLYRLPTRTVQPYHPMQAPWSAPFFYEDSHHVFYVSSAQQTVTISEFQGYAAPPKTPPYTIIPQIPPLVKPRYRIPDRIGPVMEAVFQGVINPAPIERFVSEDAYINKGLGALGSVRFGNIDLGPMGALNKKGGN